MSDGTRHIMVVGAHAGDGEIMAGLLVAKYTRAGHRATFVHLTPGEKGHPTLAPEAYAEQKRREAVEVDRRLGAETVFLPYKDAELPLNDEVKVALCDVIRERRPDILVTHWQGSIHPDHERAHFITEGARFFAALPAIQRALPAHGAWGLWYAENWEDPYGFEIDTYVDVSDVFDLWVDAVQGYELFGGKVSSFRYLDYYKALATLRGCLAGTRYAVGLMSPRGTNVRKEKAGLPGFPV
ncbi:PIG-L deacetylase family protein [Limnochorda pilosa]|uniref:LmbE family protein n=1 Tax=Limnochorda pilosa TaxID=1555112 RepID=A0A0K2SMQ3_LIMPI|nr:PIG-L family deacetylase [Limnochorda pilosa]BAS28282.1 LmbE family protein [Limnochorda pilosa]